MKVGIIILLFSIFLVMIPAQSSALYSIQSDYKTMDYEIIFHSSWNKCTKRNLEALLFYNLLTLNYLVLSGIDIGSINVKCLGVKDKFSIDNIKPSTELTILILDYIRSEDYIRENKRLGEYSFAPHDGIFSSVIITNARTLKVGSVNTAWTLSHELMHFLVNYKNFGYKYHEEYVHAVDDTWDYDCPDKNRCREIWSTIEIFKNFYAVMKPMEKPVTPKPSWEPEDDTPSVIITEKMTIEEYEEQEQEPPPEPTCASGYVLKNGLCVVEEKEKTSPKKLATKTTLFINGNIIFGNFDHNQNTCFNITLNEGDSSKVIPYERVRLAVTSTGDVYGEWIIPSWSYPMKSDGTAEHCMVWDDRNDRVYVQAIYGGNERFQASVSESVFLW